METVTAWPLAWPWGVELGRIVASKSAYLSARVMAWGWPWEWKWGWEFEWELGRGWAEGLKWSLEPAPALKLDQVREWRLRRRPLPGLHPA